MSVTFITPPLVEGPKIAFFIPLPEFLEKLPLGVAMGNGRVGLPVTMTVVGSWFVYLSYSYYLRWEQEI